MEAATTTQKPAADTEVSSFAKSLFLGEIHEEMVFPFPKPGQAEQDRIRALNTSLRELAEEAKEVGLAVVVWSYPRGSASTNSIMRGYL